MTGSTLKFPAPRGTGDLLAFAFGTVTALWAVGYLGRMPGLLVPGAVLAPLFVAVMIGGGILFARLTSRTMRGAAFTGLLISLINLKILGSFLIPDENPIPLPPAWIWLPGACLATVALFVLGHGLGRLLKPASPAHEPDWTVRFALMAVAATALLMLAGGLVTARKAGLAVPDWPRSYGYNMFLYPFTRMTGNIYFEHTHRLMGTLVGLVTIALAVYLWITDRRAWLRGLAALAAVSVIGQGIMGGLRVSQAINTPEGIEVSTPDVETFISNFFRVSHGAFAQIFLALLIALSALASRAWRDRTPHAHASATLDHRLTLLCSGLLVVQLLLGAMVRHLPAKPLMWHISLAMVLFVLILTTGMRLWGIHGDQQPVLRKCGQALVGLVIVQIGLGFAALVSTQGTHATEPVPASVFLTTLHQLTGATLLGTSVLAAIWSRGLIQPATAVPQTAGASA